MAASIHKRRRCAEKCTWIDACHMYSLLFRLWPLSLKGLDPRFATQQVKRVCFGDSLRSVFTIFKYISKKEVGCELRMFCCEQLKVYWYVGSQAGGEGHGTLNPCVSGHAHCSGCQGCKRSFHFGNLAKI